MAHTHGGHTHSHGSVDGNIIENKEATRVLTISLIGLLLTAVFQAVIVSVSGSTALLADTIHNFGDSLTSVPLWIAFALSRRRPTKRFTFGFNRSEDLAGLIIVLVIFLSAVIAGYESIGRLFTGSSSSHLGATAVAAIAGFIGNEAVAIYRIRMGKRIESAALIADGHHARIDGWTSLAVLAGVLGTWLGFPVIDPIIGLIITLMILVIVKDSAMAVFERLLDGIDPKYIDIIEKAAARVKGVRHVGDVKARWLGHQLVAELGITLASDSSVREGHAIVRRVIHCLQHEIEHLSAVQIHVDPIEEQGPSFHAHEHAHHGQELHEHRDSERHMHHVHQETQPHAY
ncbi:cation diffusion facilitator family transporter [Sporolactobacillus putidus]|uniref:Cation transporter n=1 Tax=Sporolactobacillus putidus TaxID=492735 RepID=A0A917S212_9BACL|nr:cation diffusion facilitator family transporter [Sporolactobacillus putidus]GGL51741.1 cation transporter [Sporolactobacillus putidus]